MWGTTMARGAGLGLAALVAAFVGFAACSGDGDDAGTGGSGTGGHATGGNGQGGAVVPEGHPRIYLNQDNRSRLEADLAASAPAASRFRDMVDAQMAGADYYAFDPHFAALLGALTGDAAYCDYAVAMADGRLASEEALIAAGERADVAGDSYLYVGDMVGDLSLVYDWCFDTLTADQRARIIAYANQAVWNVWHPDEATWGGVSYPWSGWSLSNPSNNYYYSFLRATMLLGLATLGENPDAQGWLDRFRVDKIESELVPTFESDLAGGGSREGTGYGVSMRRLFELYDLWESTTGERIWDLTGHTRASLPYLMHATVPTLDRLAPIGDHARDSTAALFDYHRAYALVLQRLLGPADPLADVAQTWLDDCSVPEMSQAFMFITDFLYAEPAHASRPLSDQHPSYHAPGAGHVFFRTDFQTSATWGAFIAGPFTESHAHRDQGSLLVYRGEWLAYDENVASHSGIYQEETAHNLVRIEANGAVVPQQNGAGTLASLRDLPGALYLAADVTPIYGAAAGVVRVEREVVFLKAQGAFVVMDRVDTSGAAGAVWTLNAPVAPSTVAGGFLVDGASESLAVRTLVPASPSATLVDWTTDPDMNSGYRLDLRDPAANGSARFVVVLADPSTLSTSQALSDATTVGASLAFADGSSAEVRFTRDALGATAHVVAPGNVVVLDGSLGTGVDVLPLLDVP